MTAAVIIPARLGSTRFPEKILAAQTGKPLVQHVVERAQMCKKVREVIVAADDQKIIDALRPFETKCMLTSPAHPSGTDRIAEVARSLTDDVIVNVQGDEPEIEPSTIDSLIDRLQTSADEMATAATLFPADQDANDPNLVKVVTNSQGYAIYFSRLPIPYYRDFRPAHSAAYHLHLGIYAYRRRFLIEFAQWEPTPLERAEKLEQLRALEHGRAIFVQKVACDVHGIDTLEQYTDFVKRFESH